MPLTDTARILAQTRQPASLMLWRALQPLRGLIRFMATGAHPGDEISGMLAALAYRDGLSVAYACATRGEAGKSSFGAASGAALGTIRTAELRAAADVLGLSVYWLSDGPNDSITDFGLSKSAKETFDTWGHAHTLRRLVEVIRADQPDILCPSFPDMPGQHGHHRAMAQITVEAMAAAADPAFEALGTPWQVAKLYLPAGYATGPASDDAPPPATLTLSGAGRERPSGWTWDEIGAQSRVCHASQGFGRWTEGKEPQGWPLHLAQSRFGPDRPGAHGAITDNLPNSYADFLPGNGEAQHLDRQLKACVAGFPDREAVLHHAIMALHHVETTHSICQNRSQHYALHRLDRTRAQLSRVAFIASGARLTARLGAGQARPGQTLDADLRLVLPDHLCRAKTRWYLPEGWRSTTDSLTLAADAPPHDPWPIVHHAHAPQGPVAVEVTLEYEGLGATLRLPPERPMMVLPQVQAAVTPSAVFLNSAAPRPIALHITPGASLAPPEGWSLQTTSTGAILMPETPAQGLTTLSVTVDGQAAQTVMQIDHPQLGTLIHLAPATLRLRVAKISLPTQARIACLGSGKDGVDHGLRAMGADVTSVNDPALTAEALARFDTLVIGSNALRLHPGLAAAMPAIWDWTRRGGTLLTLGLCAPEGSDAFAVAPLPLEIGSSAPRLRITDETAAVTHLSPDHPLLNIPNKITSQDWEGWVGERGHCFAKSWDAAYQPLLQMADPQEAPQQGALISARIGAGHHHHCALNLPLQMAALVPGAFRLIANLTAPRP